MISFIPAELTARIAAEFPTSFPDLAAAANPPPPADQPPDPHSGAPSAASDHQESTSDDPDAGMAAPPFMGATNFRRYRIRYKTFRRCWTRPAAQELEEDLVDGIFDLIERYGMSETRAALLHKANPSDLERWKEEEPPPGCLLRSRSFRVRAEPAPQGRGL